MSVVRMTRFTADPAITSQLLERRKALLDATRTRFSGPDTDCLVRVDDRTWVDIWRWNSAEDLNAALAGAPQMAEAGAAFSLVRDITVEVGDVVDEDSRLP